MKSMVNPIRQLVSYIAPGAAATRRPATSHEPYLRPEFGFTPNWYRQRLDIDFGERWHTDPDYRLTSQIAMRQELNNEFPTLSIGNLPDSPNSPDLVTGLFGACTIAAIYGVPIRYFSDNWPCTEQRYLTDDEAAALKPPDLKTNSFFDCLLRQIDWIADHHGPPAGYLNWQGILNNAYRLRGEAIFTDMAAEPSLAHHIFSCVAQTMIEAMNLFFEKQASTGVRTEFCTVSNCLVNMISPGQYEEFLLQYDIRLARQFGSIGIHNCAWTADPYLDGYAQVPNLGYIDMGLHSNLARAKTLFAAPRRSLMYTPMDLHNKPLIDIEQDLRRIASEYGPCDVVFADIEAHTHKERILQVAHLAEIISREFML